MSKCRDTKGVAWSMGAAPNRCQNRGRRHRLREHVTTRSDIRTECLCKHPTAEERQRYAFKLLLCIVNTRAEYEFCSFLSSLYLFLWSKCCNGSGFQSLSNSRTSSSFSRRHKEERYLRNVLPAETLFDRRVSKLHTVHLHTVSFLL